MSNGSRSKSPSKSILSSPEKSPKKRRKKFPPKPEKKDHDGTIMANPHFDAERTAQRLLQALQGINSDSKLLIEILVTHSRAQREKIKASYDPLTRGDLVTDIKDQLGGMFCDTMVGLVLEPTRFDARCLKDIVDKYEENLGFEKSFISILAIRTKKQVDEIRRFYKKDFNEDLDVDILRCVKNVEGYQSLIPNLLSTERDNSKTAVDTEAAKLTAQKLAENGIKDDGKGESENKDEKEDEKEDKEEVEEGAETKNVDYEKKEESKEETPRNNDGQNMTDLEELVLCRSPNQIKETVKQYEAISAADLLETIRMEFPELKAEAFSSLFEIMLEPSLYFAQELDEAVQGPDSDEDTIIRIFLSRNEIDLKIIVEKFKELSGKELDKSIEQDLGGDFQQALLKILNPDLKL